MGSTAWFKRMVSVYGNTVADGSVTSAKFAAGAVDETALGSNAVVAAKIKDGEVTAAKLDDDAVTTNAIADDAVTQDKLADDAVGTDQIEDGSITSAKLAEAMDTAAIADGAVTNVKIADGANIAPAKIALSSGKVLIGDATNVAVEQTLSGDVTVNAAGVATIAAGSIVNADINAAAAIALSKLAAVSDGNLIIGSGANVATSVAMSGDATIANDGTLTIGSKKVDADNLTVAEGSIFLGGADSVVAALDCSGDGQIVVGNGTTLTSVAVSGDATLANDGTLTVGAKAIDATKLTVAEGSLFLGGADAVVAALDAKTDGYIIVGNGTTAASVAVSGDATLANTGAVTIANNAVTDAKVSSALQDSIPQITVSGVDNTDGTGTFTVQVKDAAGNNLEEYFKVNVWRAASAYAAPAAATGFATASGTLKRTLTANADLEVITTSAGAATFTVTDAGAHHVMAEIDGRIYTGTVTVTGP